MEEILPANGIELAVYYQPNGIIPNTLLIGEDHFALDPVLERGVRNKNTAIQQRLAFFIQHFKIAANANKEKILLLIESPVNQQPKFESNISDYTVANSLSLVYLSNFISKDEYFHIESVERRWEFVFSLIKTCFEKSRTESVINKQLVLPVLKIVQDTLKLKDRGLMKRVGIEFIFQCLLLHDKNPFTTDPINHFENFFKEISNQPVQITPVVHDLVLEWIITFIHSLINNVGSLEALVHDMVYFIAKGINSKVLNEKHLNYLIQDILKVNQNPTYNILDTIQFEWGELFENKDKLDNSIMNKCITALKSTHKRLIITTLRNLGMLLHLNPGTLPVLESFARLRIFSGEFRNVIFISGYKHVLALKGLLDIFTPVKSLIINYPNTTLLNHIKNEYFSNLKPDSDKATGDLKRKRTKFN